MTDKTDYHPTGGGAKNPNSLSNLRPFGTENANPQSQDAGGNKPWSIRNSVRHLARQPLDMEAKDGFKKLLPKNPTVAQVIAANTLAKATKADMRAVEYVTDQIDGKVAQTNINADFAALMGMSDDELRSIANGVDTAAEGSSGEDGTAAEIGSEGAATEQDEPGRKADPS